MQTNPNSLPIATLVTEYNQYITKLTGDLIMCQAQIKHLTSLLEGADDTEPAEVAETAA